MFKKILKTYLIKIFKRFHVQKSFKYSKIFQAKNYKFQNLTTIYKNYYRINGLNQYSWIKFFKQQITNYF